MTKKFKNILNVSLMVLCSAIFTGVTVFANTEAGDLLTEYIEGNKTVFGVDFKEKASYSRDLNRKIVQEGTVLLKNNNQDGQGLPLKEDVKKVNLFGWNSSRNGFIYSGIGAGAVNLNGRVSLADAFGKAGISVNPRLEQLYKDFYDFEPNYSNGNDSTTILRQPDINYFNENFINELKQYSETAFMVISRGAGDNIGEVPLSQNLGNQIDSSRHYLQLTRKEEELLNIVKNNFQNTIVILNTGNALELSFADDEKIDAVLSCGIVGVNGTEGIVDIITGRVSPSARLVDTYISDYKRFDPTFPNHKSINNNIAYKEDIYYGYKYFETKYKNDEYFYDEAVIYPFGYGLSYSKFMWTLTNVSLPNNSNLSKDGIDSHITLTFACTNIGNVKGKDVIQLYYRAPYFENEIEKSDINFLDFAKSAELYPGQTQTGITISFDSYDLASYDAYDRNNNGKRTFELDPGKYEILIKDNAHTYKELANNTSPILNYYVKPIQNNLGIYYLRDPQSSRRVTNRFTQNKAIGDVPIDGNSVGIIQNYQSRSNFKNTFPSTANSDLIDSELSKAHNFISHYFDQDTSPLTNKDHNLRIYKSNNGNDASYRDLNNRSHIQANDQLIKDLLSDYDSALWDKLIEQISPEDVKTLIESATHSSKAIEILGKPKYLHANGGQGIFTTERDTLYTGFACQTTVAQTFNKELVKQLGQSIALEAKSTGIDAIYGPSLNIHRSQFNFKNYENYSEDPRMCGILGAEFVKGAKSYGLQTYLKYFGTVQAGDDPYDVNTWLTEQNLRENYLKPFEIAVKKGQANAILSSFNNIGGITSGKNYALNVSILRNEWGFKGTVIAPLPNSSWNNDMKAFIRGGTDLGQFVIDKANLSISDISDVYCMKNSIKNLIYTEIDTYQCAKNYEPSQDDVTINLGQGFINVSRQFPTWKIGLYVIDGLAVICLGLWIYFVFFYVKKSKKN